MLLGQARMNALIMEELKKYPKVSVRFNTEVAGVQEKDEQVTALIHNTTTSDDYFVTADFLIGADGANSRIRENLMIPFDGFSFNDFRMIGTDVYYDFQKHFGSKMNFVVDTVDWATVVYTGQDEPPEPGKPAVPVWRIAYAELITDDKVSKDLQARAKERLSRYAHGHSDFQIKRVEPYTLHQRCARIGHKGRIGLAGDALHSNNPIGGLGLTTGILDAHSYGLALVRILKDGEPASLFARCAESRREAWLTTTGPTALRNLKRISSEATEDVAERDEFFSQLNTDKEFPAQLRDDLEKMRGEQFD